MKSLRAWWERPWIFGLALVVATFAAYLPCLHGQMLWDDDSWTTKISSLFENVSGLWVMFSQPGALQQYFPLTGASFWLDYHLWGYWMLPYHVENVLLHGVAAVLFWRLLVRLELPGARLAAAIFALHPLMAESVSWITERKNVLSLVLYLGAVLAYGRFCGFWKGKVHPKEAAAPQRARGRKRNPQPKQVRKIDYEDEDEDENRYARSPRERTFICACHGSSWTVIGVNSCLDAVTP
jgi:hypothetical protein